MANHYRKKIDGDVSVANKIESLLQETHYILKASETQTANTYLALRVSCYDELGTCAASCVVLHRR